MNANLAWFAKTQRHQRIDLADLLHGQIRAFKLPDPVREYRPWPDRRFRIDLAWVSDLVFAEVDGGEFVTGRHGRGLGMQADCYKFNRLVFEGWTGFRFTGSMVKSGEAVTFLEQVFRRDRASGSSSVAR